MSLKQIYTLLRSRKSWTQGSYARTRSGTPVFGDNPRAQCWCLAGAVQHVLGRADIVGSWATAHLGMTEGELIHFNDSHSHEEVLAFIKEKMNAKA